MIFKAAKVEFTSNNEKVAKWYFKRSLAINKPQTKCMLYCPKNKQVLQSIHQWLWTETGAMMCLSIILDGKLSFGYIDHISLKKP